MTFFYSLVNINKHLVRSRKSNKANLLSKHTMTFVKPVANGTPGFVLKKKVSNDPSSAHRRSAELAHVLVPYCGSTSSTWMRECIDDSSIHLVVDSTVRFNVAPAKSAHYISMAHRPCGAWGECVSCALGWNIWIASCFLPIGYSKPMLNNIQNKLSIEINVRQSSNYRRNSMLHLPVILQHWPIYWYIISLSFTISQTL